MDREAKIRRAVHLSAPLFLVYYFLPSPLWAGGPSREIGLVVILGAVLVFELLRLRLGLKVPGMRGYERYQLSAAAWAAMAMTVAMLFFPLDLAAPAVVGMALVDPLISRLRRTRWYPGAPLAVHFLLVLAILLLFHPLSVRVVFAAAVAAALAVGAEAVKTRYVDDDFLMIVVPLVGLAAVMGL